jgi:hypothetical protein
MGNNTSDNSCTQGMSRITDNCSDAAFYDASGIHIKETTFLAKEIECYNSYK